MPIFRTPVGLGYYAHVPKAGGTSVEAYLADRFGPLAFLDPGHARRPDAWTRSSPQHAPAAAVDRLFPEGFFALTFATVRHPVARLVSAWRFHREWTGAVPGDLTFAQWVKDLETGDPDAYDRHGRPMSETVPEAAQVFRLEDGLDAITAWLDEATGTEGPTALPAIQRREDLPNRQNAPEMAPAIGPDTRARIERIYAEDYARFGYEAG